MIEVLLSKSLATVRSPGNEWFHHPIFTAVNRQRWNAVGTLRQQPLDKSCSENDKKDE
jgi:hypothetical protein